MSKPSPIGAGESNGGEDVVRDLRCVVLTGGQHPLYTPDVNGFGLRWKIGGVKTCFEAGGLEADVRTLGFESKGI